MENESTKLVDPGGVIAGTSSVTAVCEELPLDEVSCFEGEL